MVAPAAAELSEGLPVDGGGETLGAGPQPALEEDVDHVFVQLAPDGVVRLEGRGQYIVGDSQEGLEERVPRLEGEAHGRLLDEGVRYLEYLVAQTDVTFGDGARALRRREDFRELFEYQLGVEIRVQNDGGRDARFGQIKRGQPVTIYLDAAVN